MHTYRVSRFVISSSGSLRHDFTWNSDDAPRKTGMDNISRGDCEQDGIDDMMRLASGGSSDSGRDSDRGDRSDRDDDRRSDEREDSRADDRSSDDSSSGASDDSSAEDSARAEQEAREQAERESREREEADERAKAEERRTAERERRERQQAEQRAEEEKEAKEKADAEKRKREEEEARKEAERKRKEEEENRLIEFKEGVVLCEKGAGRESRCHGPLQMTIVEVKTLDDPATRGNVGMACGSDRSLRDLGMVNSMRAFGCGFGIHPSPNMASYPGNTDVAGALPRLHLRPRHLSLQEVGQRLLQGAVMRVLDIGLAVSALALLPAAAAAQSSDETKFYHCSYSADGDKYWTAVETRLSYEALADQWKAYAKGRDGSIAYCFSRYRKDDPAYQSLDEVEAIGRLTAGAKKVDWTPRQAAASASKSKPVKAPKPAVTAASDADAARAARKAEHEAKVKRYEEGLAAHEAAVAKYERERQEFEADRAARQAAAKAAQEEAARKQAEHEAEVERVREQNRRAQAEYEEKLRAAAAGVK